MCPQSFCPHVPMTAMTEEARETTMVIGKIILQVKFIVANVQPPLIGLPDMDFNEVVMHTGNEPYIDQYGHNEQAMRIGSQLYVAAMVRLPLLNALGKELARSLLAMVQAHWDLVRHVRSLRLPPGARDLQSISMSFDA
eukprot:4780762-Amphidinium_carterae.1